MRKIALLIITLIFPIYYTFAQMSDSQVIDYVKAEHAKGTSQQTIGASLLQKGVTKSQLEKIKQQVEAENQSKTTTANRTTTGDVLREDREDSISYKPFESDTISNMLRKDIFGKNIFNKKNLSFAPNVNIATPSNYRLGTGDEVVIEIWGASQASIRKTISPEGTISIDNIGPISLSGMSILEANNYIRNKLSSLYSGVEDSDGSSQIKLTLGQIRTIQINVMGEVAVPGTYSLSSLSSIFHALYLAGGINDIGSLRDINLYRNGKQVTSVDIYDFLLHGKTDNTHLYDGDIIIVPPYKSLVNITGQVKRPMYYEMKESETLADIIKYSGGFVGGAYSDKISLVRKTGGYNKIFTLKGNDDTFFGLADGDTITVGEGLGLYENRVQIIGKVFRPGYYQIGQDITTIKDLITRAGGTIEDAFLDRAILTRQKADLTLETLTLNIKDIFSGKTSDVPLKKNDILFIAANKIDTDLGDLSIYGMVANPGTYEFAENTTVKDLILKSGGLLSSASTAKVDVSRRIIDPNSTTDSNIIARTYSFPIENGLIANNKDEFVLEPYDQVYIRRSPGYQTQRNVTLSGEILFPGTYTLRKKEQRLSDLIKEAGGLSKEAFASGARLTRKQSEEDQIKNRQTLDMISRGGMTDSISTENLDLGADYVVGIELDKALASPKSEYDIVLKDGDKLFIPEFDNTVKINGAVMFPNTVLYRKDMKLDYYINQAGGYGDLAQKKKAYVVYMNGTITKAKKSDRDLIRPGCQIIVPSKEKRPPMSLGEKVAIGSSVTSMASVIALLINSLTN